MKTTRTSDPPLGWPIRTSYAEIQSVSYIPPFPMSLTIPGVYMIRNTVNGKVYVGSSSNIRNRWKLHENKLEHGTHANRHLQGAWQEYGRVGFEFVVLEYIPNIEGLIIAEQVWMEQLQALDSTTGYNLRVKAESNRGLQMTLETRQRQSVSHMGNKNNLGKRRSAEAIEKFRQKMVGRPFVRKVPLTLEQYALMRERMRASRIGIPSPLKGIKRPDGFGAKVSAGLMRVRGKIYDGFVAPDGTVIGPVSDLKRFCIHHNLGYSGMLGLYAGRDQSYHGWTIAGRPPRHTYTSRELAAIPKQDEALRLRQSGWTYPAIAIYLGYKDKTGSQKAVKAALKRLRQCEEQLGQVS